MKINEIERKSTLDKIINYIDDDYFVSFTNIEKVGINPRSVHTTPNAVYAYPLSSKIIQNQLSGNIDHIKYVFPYAADTTWVNILQAVQPLQEVSDYTEKQFKKDMSLVIDISEFTYEDIVNMFGKELAYMDHPFEKLWYVTEHISKIRGKNQNNYWAMMLINLGYSGFEDKYGNGWIYKSEPVQAFFLKPSAYKVIDRFKNDWVGI